jgi:tRNA (guanine37-N1)-methyltransferase
MVVIEAVTRLVPGVLGNEVSVTDETFADDLLEYPQWTRPALFREFEVPETLRSGDHALIHRWRRAMAIARTAELRPDLLERRGVSQEESLLLSEFNISVDPRFVSE